METGRFATKLTRPQETLTYIKSTNGSKSRCFNLWLLTMFGIDKIKYMVRVYDRSRNLSRSSFQMADILQSKRRHLLRPLSDEQKQLTFLPY